MIFPQQTITAPSSSPVTYGTEINYDFAAEAFVLVDGEPEVLTGLAALRKWIEKTLLTARYRWPIYDWSYGSEIEELIGKNLSSPVTREEIKRYIKEALIYDERISAVKDFEIEQDEGTLQVTFTVTTTLGDTLTEVITYV